MKIIDMKPGEKAFAQLGHRVLAVLSVRHDGWCVYVDAVSGFNHDEEWQAVADNGDKQREAVARAIIGTLFYPPFDPEGVPYAS